MADDKSNEPAEKQESPRLRLTDYRHKSFEAHGETITAVAEGVEVPKRKVPKIIDAATEAGVSVAQVSG